MVTGGPAAPAKVNLRLYEDDTFEQTFRFYSDETTVLPLAGYTFVASFADTGLADASVGSGIAVNAGAGEITLTLPTTGLTFSETRWQLDATFSGDTFRWIEGKIVRHAAVP